MSEFIEAAGNAAPGVVATAYGVRLFGRVVGPSIDQFAGSLSQFVGQRTQNFLGIAKAAADVVGEDPGPGLVHPRVVHQVIEEATWLDDPVMQAYAGGMLAASRTETGSDDRAAYYIRVLTSLTANQLRLHHGVYQALAVHDRGNVEIGDSSLVDRMTIVASIESAAALLSYDETTSAENAVDEAVIGLIRESALRPYFGIGTADYLKQANLTVSVPSMVVTPSSVGALLYLWGRGIRTANAELLGHVTVPRLDPPGPHLAATVGRWE